MHCLHIIFSLLAITCLLKLIEAPAENLFTPRWVMPSHLSGKLHALALLKHVVRALFLFGLVGLGLHPKTTYGAGWKTRSEFKALLASTETYACFFKYQN